MNIFKMLPYIAVSLFLSCAQSDAIAQTLHGNAAEEQAVKEMTTRLREALSKGDFAACGREGENMAKYGVESSGETLIRRDQATVQAELDLYHFIYKIFYDIRNYYNNKSIKAAYSLIDQLENKFTEEAFVEVAMTFVQPHHEIPMMMDSPSQ